MMTRKDTMDDDDSNNKEEDYTTTFTKILQQKKKYPALHYIHANIMNRNNNSNNCSSIVFAGGQNNYNYYHPNNSKNKIQQEYTSGRRQLGIRMIQQRWQRGGRAMTTTMDNSPKKNNRMIEGWSNTADNDDDALFHREKDDDDDDDDEDAVIFCHNDKRQKRGRGRSAHDDDFSDFSDESLSSLSPCNYNNNAATFSSFTNSIITSTTNANNNNKDDDNKQPPTTTTTPLSIQPTLLFRRTHANLSYYSSTTTRHYTNIQFLNNPSVVIGVDNYGDLDVVRVPLSSCCSSFGSGGGGGYNDGDGTRSSSNDDEEDGGGGGIGTLQANRMPISNEMIHRHNNIINNSNNNNGGPRQPMDNFHYEVYGYDNGTKFAVGLRSGRVQLFTTERAAAAAAASDRGATTTTSSSSSCSLASTNALWSCLPSSTITTTTTTIGPRRRYRAHDKYPLIMMLSNTTTTTTTNNKSNLFDAYNTSFLEEISDWDSSDDYFKANRLRGDGYPWAFREGGGLSGTALMGACVDVENGDCFSLRVIDERCCCQQSNNGNDSSSLSACSSAMLNVVVVDDRSSKRRLFNSATTERVDSVCFSGEYGLVTSHSITRKKNDIDSRLTATSIKWWDHRMLRSHQPVNSMCLSFPRDNVSLLSPDTERYLAGAPPSLLDNLSMEQPLDRTTNFGLFQVNRLVGARDSSDRFAIHLKKVCSRTNPNRDHPNDEVVLMVDSCRGEITQQIRYANFGGLSPSISSYLDTMACFTTKKEDEEQCISIYDVSRHRNDDVASSRHDSYEYLSGKKRQFHNDDDDVSDDEIMCGEGLLRRLSPKVQDMYGIQSSLTCMTIDDYGATIACGTCDGDMFLLNSSDLGGLAG